MLRAPEPLNSNHEIAGFDCGVASLNTWLERGAAANQVSGASRTFVLCDGSKVADYYALASSAVAPAVAPDRLRGSMPDPVPVVVFGRALFQDAALRVIHAAEAIGIRGLVVHAFSEEAKAFNLGLGLDGSPLDPMTLIVTVADLHAALPRSRTLIWRIEHAENASAAARQEARACVLRPTLAGDRSLGSTIASSRPAPALHRRGDREWGLRPHARASYRSSGCACGEKAEMRLCTNEWCSMANNPRTRRTVVGLWAQAPFAVASSFEGLDGVDAAVVAVSR